MTSLQKQIDENADSIERLLEIIKNLEERIMVLELSSPYRKVRDDEAGEEYWEHG